MQPWQEKLLVDIESGGLKPGEMFVMMSGRNIGKSVLNEHYKTWKHLFNIGGPYTRMEGPSMVDGKPWYVVSCGADAAKWIRKQDSSQWYEHSGIPSVFDISENLYILMGLKWQSEP
jgi:hypothetical protein